MSDAAQRTITLAFDDVSALAFAAAGFVHSHIAGMEATGKPGSDIDSVSRATGLALMQYIGSMLKGTSDRAGKVTAERCVGVLRQVERISPGFMFAYMYSLKQTDNAPTATGEPA